MKYVIPSCLHFNQESEVVSELYKLYGVKKSCATPYHPTDNAPCERFNWTLHDLLRTLALEKKHWWHKYLSHTPAVRDLGIQFVGQQGVEHVPDVDVVGGQMLDSIQMCTMSQGLSWTLLL